MSSDKVELKNSRLELIKEKFFSGKAALEEPELKRLYIEFEEELRKWIEKRELGKNEELTESVLEIFKTIHPAEFAHTLMAALNENLYYDLGLYLVEEAKTSQDNSNLFYLLHEYLSLFRTPSFLKKIYEDKRWGELVHELIKTSNYNLPVLLSQRVREYGERPLFTEITGSKLNSISWTEAKKIVVRYAKSLYHFISNENHDEVKVTFLLENSLQMPLLDLACLTTGIVNVMIPANSVSEHILFILNQTESPVLILHDEKQLAKIKSIKSELKYLKQAVMLFGNSSEDWVISFNDFVDRGKDVKDEELDSIRNKITMKSLASIMYTSGTTGEPKGIMFSQMNIVYKRFCRAMALPEIGDADRFLAFLPLFHTFGRWLEMMGSIFWGAEYYFMENPAVETMAANMKLIKPTIFISIPKKWLQLYEQITARIDIETEEDNVIKRVVKELTGGELRWGLSAAGYLPPDVFKFFQNYGIELMSGFGMTEATGGITMTPPKKYKENSLGKALPGIQIKLGEDGEILIKGSYVMEGYYGKSFEETFTADGWLPTGDVMKMDENGFIEIIDRKKEIYKNIKGETIAPQKIENLFREFETVKQVFLVGDHRPFNTVLIYPDYTLENSLLTELDEKSKQEFFSSLIVTVNKFLAPFERILDFRIIDRPFTESEGELTPKGTYKRRVIEQNFDELISSMYTKNFINVILNDFEVKIPNWFLREKGCLNRDIIAGKDEISIPKIDASLKIKQIKDGIFHIGNYSYKINSKQIDFQNFLTNPIYWMGNQKLFSFAGRSIFQWIRNQSRQADIKFHASDYNIVLDKELIQNFKKINQQNEFSVNGLHIAALIFQSDNVEMHGEAIKYLTNILSDETNYNYNLAIDIASRPDITTAIETRRELFKSISYNLEMEKFEEILLSYIRSDFGFINTDIKNYLVKLNRGEDFLSVTEGILQLEIEKIEGGNRFDKSSAASLLNLLESYGCNHPTMYKRIRRSIMRMALFTSSVELKEKAESAIRNMMVGLRKWIGKNQTVAVDLETNEEYGWEDVIIFDDNIVDEDKKRMKEAILNSSVLREAVFLFSGGFLLRLENVLPGGVWISHLVSVPYKSIYRITIQTRFHGGFDITMHLTKNLPHDHINEEIKWLILPAATPEGERLLPKFGGYWEKYGLWTEDFVPRESIEKFISKTVIKGDEGSLQRLRYLWTFFVWNAAAAYTNFWKLTNYQFELANPLPENIAIPTHDYQTGTILYSVSQRVISKNITNFVKTFYNLFVEQTVEKYKVLEKKSIWNYIFSGIVEVEGEYEGLRKLNTLKSELIDDDKFPPKDKVLSELSNFIDTIENEGFIPKSLFFAIKRFHRWLELNEDASFKAQAEMLFELYETYQLFDLEKIHRSTRTKFFLETAFYESDNSFKEALKDIAAKQREGSVTEEEKLKLISGLQSAFVLSEKESFFLIRLSYPHLKPTDLATLLEVSSAEEMASNLVVSRLDEEGKPYIIRMPVSPKEISRLHQLFFESNLMVHFRPEHHFLVALSERGFIIGGLFYNRISDDTVYMDKIVVSNRYRRKGISEGLMNELFNRLKSGHIKNVTTGFFRPEYFYKFGFKIEKKYSGLVKNLT